MVLCVPGCLCGFLCFSRQGGRATSRPAVARRLDPRPPELQVPENLLRECKVTVGKVEEDLSEKSFVLKVACPRLGFLGEGSLGG